MFILTLVENNKPSGSELQERFGLGFYVETLGRRILFDVGPDDAFEKNARLLGIDLEQIDACILSHAHYDHTAGLRDFFRINAHTPVFLRSEAFGNYFSESRGPKRYIGISHTLFNEYKHRFHFINRETNLFGNIRLHEINCDSFEKPLANRLLFKETDAGYGPDDFKHEMIMTIEEMGKLFLFTGCAHHGVRNMILSVRKYLPDMPIKALIGGFHLALPGTDSMEEPVSQVKDLGKFLVDQHIEKVFTGHCTGETAYGLLKEELGDSLGKLYTGLTMQF